MKRVAVIGLGIMGLPMATNLVRAGFDVVGFNRSPARSAELAHRGGVAAASIAAAVSDAEGVVTVLPDTPDVEDVVLGPDGVLAYAPTGSLIVDMSTIQPATSRRIARAGEDRGISVLDAPVSGGERGAQEGALSIMVGGERESFDAAKPLFEAMGKMIVHVGPHGAGQTVKAANQMIVASTIGAVAEALTMLEALGVDMTAAIEVLSGGLAGSRVMDEKAAKMTRGDFAPGFRIALHHKDLGIALSTARAAGVATPLAAVVDQELASMEAQGRGGLDHGGLIAFIRQLSGRG